MAETREGKVVTILLIPDILAKYDQARKAGHARQYPSIGTTFERVSPLQASTYLCNLEVDKMASNFVNFMFFVAFFLLIHRKRLSLHHSSPVVPEFAQTIGFSFFMASIRGKLEDNSQSPVHPKYSCIRASRRVCIFSMLAAMAAF